MATKEEYGRALQAAHDAGDEEAAATLAAAYTSASDEPQLSTFDKVANTLRGVDDVALAAARGTAHQLVGTAFGIGGAIHQGLGKLGLGDASDPNSIIRPNMSYMKGKAAYDLAASSDELPIKGGQLRTPEGAKVAQAISDTGVDIPFAGHYTVGDLGKGIENVGQGVENIAGPEARDALGSLITVATMRSPAKVAPATDAARAVRDMRNAGYITTPTAPIGGGKYAGTVAERKLASLVDADSLIAVKNQEKTDRFGAIAGNLPEGTTTAGGVEAATQAATKDYEAIKAVKAPIKLQADAQFIQGIQDIGKRVIGSNEPVDASIARMQSRLLASNMDVSGVVDRVGELRKSSYTNITKGTTDEARRLGLAQREAADVLEGSLDRFFQRATARSKPGSPVGVLYDNWVKARSRLSTLHILRDSMNETTGTLDAAKVAKEVVDRGFDKVNPALKVIARAYQTDPNALRNVARAAKRGSAVPISLVGSSVAGGVLGSYLGTPGMIIGALAPVVSRELARQFIARGKTARLTQRAVGQANRTVARGVVGAENIDEQP
jgi:hypothetical protein